MAIETDSVKPSNRDIGLWVPLREASKRLIEPPKNFLLRRTIRTVVDLHSSKEIDNATKAEMAAGKIPILISNHQQHIDGFVFAVIAKRVIRLAAVTPGAPPFPGFIAPGAKSWEEGYQGGHLKVGLDVFRKAGEQLGLEVAGVTREKDEDQYGMDRSSSLTSEMRPIRRGLRQGKGLAILPEGSWTGGKHPKEAGVEEIFGLQNFTVNMAEWVGIVEKATGKEAFIIVAGINGSYRYVQNGEGEEPNITPEGWRALLVGATGLHWGYRRIQVNLRPPITKGKIETDLGSNWRENGEAFNEYLMNEIALVIPDYARGVCRKSVVELSQAS